MMQEKPYMRAMSHWVMGLIIGIASLNAMAQQSNEATNVVTDDLGQWMTRIEAAAKTQDYTGTYVIVQSNQLRTLKTIHTFHNGEEYELISALDGEERYVFRQGRDYYAVYPESKKVTLERQSVAQMFPSFILLGNTQPEQFYNIKRLYSERFLGRDANVVRATPVDQQRFGYKAWVDQKTGLLLRLDIEDAEGAVLQHFAFTNIEFEASGLDKENLSHYIQTLKAQEYQLQEWAFSHTTPQQQGWQLRTTPAGFKAIRCVLRPLSNLSQELVQWVFSDGVASVSIFIELKPLKADEDQARHVHHYGATHGLSYQFSQWHITLVGEVPEETLQQFADALERAPTLNSSVR